jgi:predicted dehydrogenase
LRKLGRPEPAQFVGRKAAKVLRSVQPDLVLIATGWESHVPLALEAMKNGAHVGLEVPGAVTVNECWQLVDASEATRRHCTVLENVNYGWAELAALRIVRSGTLGPLIRGKGAYLHDLRELLVPAAGEVSWRGQYHLTRNGNLYPTHGLGPVATCMDLNRGDRVVSLVSESSGEFGLSLREKQLNVPAAERHQWKCGDFNTSLLRTEKGRLIQISHSVTSGGPYDREFSVTGTDGHIECDQLWCPTILDGVPIPLYTPHLVHPLWRNPIGEESLHRDYLMVHRLIGAMVRGFEPDMNVYDAALLSVIGPLSDISVAEGKRVPVPDFTQGEWKQAQPNFTH